MSEIFLFKLLAALKLEDSQGVCDILNEYQIENSYELDMMLEAFGNMDDEIEYASNGQHEDPEKNMEFMVVKKRIENE